jgi:hypothetical protein
VARPIRDGKIDLLATKVAEGHSVAAAARAIGVPERTARLWASKPEFKTAVADIRRSVVSQTVGILSRASVKATGRLVKLTESADEDIALKASNSLLDKLMAIRSHLELEARIEALEKGAGPNPSGYGMGVLR